MSLTPFSHSYLHQLFDASAVAPLFTAEADVQQMLQFELALAQAETALSLIDKTVADELAQVLTHFTPDFDQLAVAAARDGVVVPALLAQLKPHLSVRAAQQLHFGATSQDATDSSLMLRCTQALHVLAKQVDALDRRLHQFSADFGNNQIFARTRMQQALPIELAVRVQRWQTPLQDTLAQINELLAQKLPLSLGGPVGDRRQFAQDADALVARVAQILNLRPTANWHTNRQIITALGQTMTQLTTACGKIGADVGLMTQNEVGDLSIRHGGGSSAMAHKNNPVNAEILVSLARFNATQLAGLHHAALHEQERSGAAWSLEWMLLPQMVAAASAGLAKSKCLLDQLFVE